MKRTGAKAKKIDVADLVGRFGEGESNTGRNRKKGRRAVFFIPVIIVAVLLAAMITGTALVAASDTVYPNVYIFGIELSGMTVEEAEQALRAAGYENDVENVRAEVHFPDGSFISVTAEEAGLRPDAAAAARRAFEYGRDGGFIGNALLYVRSVFSRTALDDTELAAHEALLRSLADEATERFNGALREDVYVINEEHIEFVKGSRVTEAKAEDVYKLLAETLLDSISSKVPAAAQYKLDEDADSDVIDLEAIYNDIFVPPVSSEYDPETYSATDSAIGIGFDIAAARAAVDRAATGERIKIPLIFTPPELSREELESMLFRDVLAECATDIAGTANRLNNIRLAAEACGGVILNPGEEFSFNGTVGQRTAERGYLAAGAYVGGRTVQEIGGGICQVSSMLYDLSLHAVLEVTERREHMFIVTYLPYGNDATVNWGTIDYKFINNTEFPIRIESELEGRRLTMRFVGTSTSTDTIETEYEVISSRGYSTVYVEDESVLEGERVDTSGSYGYTVDVYRLRYDKDGELLEREYIGRSTYRAQDRIVLIPVAGPENPDGSGDPTDPTDPIDPSDPGVDPGTDPGLGDPVDPDPDPEPTPDPDPPEPTPEPPPENEPPPAEVETGGGDA